MKRFTLSVLILLFLSSIITAMIPFKQLYDIAINLKPGQRGRYVLGDNISNFHGGLPFRYEAGNSYFTFSDFMAYADGKLLNRRKAVKVSILPHKITSFYRNASEQIVMFSGEQAMGMRVISARPAKLGIFPIIYMYKKITKIGSEGRIITLEPVKNKKTPDSCIALHLSQPVKTAMVSREKNKATYSVNRFRPNTVKLLFTTQQPVTELKIILAFGRTAAEAAAKARRLARKNAWREADKKMQSVIGDSSLLTDNKAYNKAVAWSLASAYSMVVEEFGKGIWAGLPWFRDNWGRDTFIALPGTLLVNGRFDEAKEVIENFARFQNRGDWVIRVRFARTNFSKAARILLGMRGVIGVNREGDGLLARPIDRKNRNQNGANRIASLIRKKAPFATVSAFLLKDRTYGRVPNRVNKSSIIYNTTDGTPWFVREVLEYLQYSGDAAFARRIYPVVKLALDSTIRYRTDRKRFLVHDAADTWMDAKIDGKQPWSPRGSRAVEIQALWYQALQAGIRLAGMTGDTASSEKWKKTASVMKKAFLRYFWNPKKKMMADRIREDGRPDYSVRPNQLMLLSIPLSGNFIPDGAGAHIVRTAVNTLLYPWGIASLDPKHPWFHPWHDGGWMYHKDAAYHNGTVWGWNAGFTVSALTRYGRQDFAWKLTKNLVDQILNQGCLGSMSENIFAWPKDGKIVLSGTFSQAWSVSEFARNAFQDYGGFRPRLLDNTLVLEPSLPGAWKRVSGKFRFGRRAVLTMRYRKGTYTLRTIATRRTLTLRFRPLVKGRRLEAGFAMKPGRTYRISVNGSRITVNGKPVAAVVFRKSFNDTIGRLRFAKPGDPKDCRPLKKKQYLRKMVMDGKVK